MAKKVFLIDIIAHGTAEFKDKVKADVFETTHNAGTWGYGQRLGVGSEFSGAFSHNYGGAVFKNGLTVNTSMIVPTPSANKHAATKEYVDANTGDSMPSGAIIMWSGSTIPSGWKKCDGTNGTPNLVNKFIRGGSSAGSTGGSDNAVNVSHNHSQGSHQHSRGSMEIKGDAYLRVAGSGYDALTLDDTGALSVSKVSYGAGRNNLDFRGNTSSWRSKIALKASDNWTGYTSSTTPSINSSGSSGTGKNIPAYYTLIYIMKI